MTWNGTWPDGTVSVKANKTPGQQNTNYIETRMQRDHFWDEDADKDGRHDAVQMPKQETGGTPTDPSLGAAMDFAFYAKEKTAADAPDNQDVQPFCRISGGVMQMLAMRAAVVFEVSGGVVTVKYAHNVDPTAGVGVVRVSAGIFTINFTTALPTDNYLVDMGAVRASTGLINTWYLGGASTKTDALSKIFCRVDNGGVEDPLQCWFMAYGG